jgi:hypothetical protein
MLYNDKHQVVHITGKFNTKDNTSLFTSLREVKELSDPCGRGTNGMFSIETRAKFKQ